jgi:hypothetical protein
MVIATVVDIAVSRNAAVKPTVVQLIDVTVNVIRIEATSVKKVTHPLASMVSRCIHRMTGDLNPLREITTSQRLTLSLRLLNRLNPGKIKPER